MTTRKLCVLILTGIMLIVFANRGISQDDPMGYWPQWRGPEATGAALTGNPPVSFGENQNLKWKVRIPGRGHATPVVWGNHIIVQTAVPTGMRGDTSQVAEPSRMPGSVTDEIHDFRVILVDRRDGRIIWEKTVHSEMPLEGTHNLGSWASNSPATDGKLIYAWFGSRGIHCLDFQGNILWQKDFGQMKKHMDFGEGSSPYLYKNRLYIQWDHEGESFLTALDTKTGNEVWRAARDEGTSWATPLVVEVNGKPQVVTCATNQVRAYDAETGEVIWTTTGLTRNVIPNPVYKDGILYVMSGFRGSALQAIDISRAKGDISTSDVIVWRYDQDTPYTPNPLLMNGKLWFLRVNNGFLTCLDAKTGAVHYSKEKLEGISTLYSSPSGVGDRFYVVSKNICLVIKAGEKYEVLASNTLDDDFHASPVIVGNELILRGFESLYCFSE